MTFTIMCEHGEFTEPDSCVECLRQAIRERDARIAELTNALKQIAAWGDDDAGALHYDKNCAPLLQLARSALTQPARGEG